MYVCRGLCASYGSLGGLLCGQRQLYNLGTGDTCSVRRIAEIVVEESGLEGVSIEYTGGDRGWAGDVPKTSLEVGRLLSTDSNQIWLQKTQSGIPLVP